MGRRREGKRPPVRSCYLIFPPPPRALNYSYFFIWSLEYRKEHLRRREYHKFNCCDDSKKPLYCIQYITVTQFNRYCSLLALNNVVTQWNSLVSRPDYMDLGFADICPMNPVEIVMELMLQEVDLMVAWAYKVPGFRELDREDRANLFSSGKCTKLTGCLFII